MPNKHVTKRYADGNESLEMTRTSIVSCRLSLINSNEKKKQMLIAKFQKHILCFANMILSFYFYLYGNCFGPDDERGYF